MLRPLFIPVCLMTMLSMQVSGQHWDDLRIEVSADASRSVLYTNKQAAFLFLEAAAAPTSSWQAFSSRGFGFIDGWGWLQGDSLEGPSQIAHAQASPDHFGRRYRSGLQERVTLLDDLDAVVIEFSYRGASWFVPFISDTRSQDGLTVEARGDVLLFARTVHLEREPTAGHPRWVAVHTPGGSATTEGLTYTGGGVKGRLFAPGAVTLPGEGAVVIALGHSAEEAADLARLIASDYPSRIEARRERMQRLLQTSFVRTEDARFNEAFAWSVIAMDALVMNQRGRGIFAGLPWFNNYWGRDTFIALPGAALVTGQYELAREILLGFADYQDREPESETYGRIPNFVSLDDVTYNTADGTPWFAVQVGEYIRHTGDREFVAAIHPVLKLASEAFLAQTDENGFLRHGHQETWMDAAAGPGQEWSPRGDRAVEIQALWYRQLLVTAEVAERVGEAGFASDMRHAAERVRQSFLDIFVDAERSLLVDRLKPDGSPDRRIRPNQFLALMAFDLEPEVEARITRNAAEHLVYPWGVSSLWQGDDAFHPYHEAPGLYPKDAAYHNGTIWTWLSGAVVSLMARQGAHEKAYEQIDYLTHLALDRQAVGTMSENSDAIPRDGASEVRLTGTVSQAWTLAEYLRNIYEDFLGVNFVGPQELTIRPALPTSWGETTARIQTVSGPIDLVIRQADDRMSVNVDGSSLSRDVLINLEAGGLRTAVPIVAGQNVSIGIGGRGAVVDGEAVPADGELAQVPARIWDGFQWQRPHIRPDLPALQGPGWPLIDHTTLKRSPVGAKVIVDAKDPAGDDRGSAGTYEYPTSPEFRPGILDIVRLTVSEDEEGTFFDLHFRDLAQPGWNPSYGFQLTFAAIAIDSGNGGAREIRRNANHVLPDGLAYSHIVFVGGGVRIEDAHGTVLGEYRPMPDDVTDPLGSVDDRVIRFFVPFDILPRIPDGSQLVVVVGAQDDHGGAGIGDFRDVGITATEWAGGGAVGPGTSNVYDELRVVVRRTHQ